MLHCINVHIIHKKEGNMPMSELFKNWFHFSYSDLIHSPLRKIIYCTDQSDVMRSCQSLGKLGRKEKRNVELMELTTEQKSSTFRGTAGTACRAPSLTRNSDMPLKRQWDLSFWSLNFFDLCDQAGLGTPAKTPQVHCVLWRHLERAENNAFDTEKNRRERNYSHCHTCLC